MNPLEGPSWDLVVPDENVQYQLTLALMALAAAFSQSSFVPPDSPPDGHRVRRRLLARRSHPIGAPAGFLVASDHTCADGAS